MPKKHPIKHVGLFEFDEVWPLLNEKWHTFHVNGEEYKVLMATRRYVNLRDTPFCCACGRKGAYLVLEHEPNNPLPKFRSTFQHVRCKWHNAYNRPHCTAKPWRIGSYGQSSSDV